jgi:hypothetical protein
LKLENLILPVANADIVITPTVEGKTVLGSRNFEQMKVKLSFANIDILITKLLLFTNNNHGASKVGN